MPAIRSPAVVIVVAPKSSRKSRSRSAPRRSRSGVDTDAEGSRPRRAACPEAPTAPDVYEANRPDGRPAGSFHPCSSAHTSRRPGGISKAIDRAEELGCDAVQVFTQSPRMWRPTAHAEDEVERFRARRDEVGIQSVVCHALYLVNLAAPDREIHKKSVAAMRASLETAAAIGAEGVVFHVGSHLGAGIAKGLKRAVPPLRELLELTDDRLWLVLENSAGAGGTMGRSVAELAAIFDALDGHPRLGICLDSCHWWVSGVDVTDRAALDAALAELDESIGLDRLRCLHVNDADAALGSNRDRHATLEAGQIGDGMATFLAHPAFEGLPAILETAGEKGYAEELRLMRALYAKGRRRRPNAALSQTVSRRSARTPGSSGSRGAARRTPGSGSRPRRRGARSTARSPTWHIGSGVRRAFTAPNPSRRASSSPRTSRSISTSNTFCMQPMYVCPHASYA